MTTNEIVDYGVYFQGEGGWYWRAMSNNGRKVAIGGEPFSTAGNAENAFHAIFSGKPLFLDGSSALAQYQKEVHGNG